MKIKISKLIGFIIFLLVSFLLCVSFFDYRSPNVDESELIFPAIQFFSGDYNPYWHGYGAFGMYLLHICFALVGFFAIAFGAYDNWNDYLVQVFAGDLFYRLARYIFTLIILLSCYFYTKTLKQLKTPFLWVSSFILYYIFSQEVVHFSNYIRCDLLISLSFAICIFIVSRNLNWRLKAILLGLVCAMSITSKISGLVLISVPFLYYIASFFAEKNFSRIPKLSRFFSMLTDFDPHTTQSIKQGRLRIAGSIRAFIAFIVSYLVFTIIFQPFEFPFIQLLRSLGSRVAVTEAESVNFHMAHDFLGGYSDSAAAILSAFKSYFSTGELLVFLTFPILFIRRFNKIYFYLLLAFASLTLPYLIAKQISPYWFIPAFAIMRVIIILNIAQIAGFLQPLLTRYDNRLKAVFNILLVFVFFIFAIIPNISKYLEFRSDLRNSSASNLIMAEKWIEANLLGTAIIYRDGYIMHKMPRLIDESVNKSKGLSRAFSPKYEREHYTLLHALFEQYHESYLSDFKFRNPGKRKIQVDDLRLVVNESNLNGNYFIATPSNHQRYLDPEKELNNRQQSIANNYRKIFDGSKKIKTFNKGSGYSLEVYKMVDVPEYEPEGAIKKLTYTGLDSIFTEGHKLDIQQKSEKDERYNMTIHFQNNILSDERYSLDDNYPRMPFLFGNWVIYKTEKDQFSLHCRKCNKGEDVVKRFVVRKDGWVALNIEYTPSGKSTTVRANNETVMKLNAYIPIPKQATIGKGYIERVWNGPIGEIYINGTEVLFDSIRE